MIDMIDIEPENSRILVDEAAADVFVKTARWLRDTDLPEDVLVHLGAWLTEWVSRLVGATDEIAKVLEKLAWLLLKRAAGYSIQTVQYGRLPTRTLNIQRATPEISRG